MMKSEEQREFGGGGGRGGARRDCWDFRGENEALRKG